MNKQPRLLLLFLFVLLSAESQQTESKFFEGEVYFKVTSTALDSRVSEPLLKLEHGNRMIGKVKRNKYLMHQNSGGKLGNVKTILFLEEGTGYIEYEKSDTIIQFSIEENRDKLISATLNKEDKLVILNQVCQSVTLKYQPAVNFGVIEYVEGTYYFHPKYRLDKKMYENHQMSFWNRFIELGNGGISVRNEILYYPLYRITYEAIKIEEKKIPDAEFEINRAKTISPKQE